MDLELTPEQTLLVDTVRRFVETEILPLELNLDPDADEIPAEDFERLTEKTKAMGLFGMDIPPEFGGPDIDLVTRTLLAIEMAQHRAGLYVPCYGVFGGAGLAQLFEATEDQKSALPLPHARRGEKRILRSIGTFRRIGPSQSHSDHCHSRWRRLDHQWRQTLDQRR